ncbi:MAG: hypothetical protein ABMB14_23260 [Myxococcota bacterium]
MYLALVACSDYAIKAPVDPGSDTDTVTVDTATDPDTTPPPVDTGTPPVDTGTPPVETIPPAEAPVYANTFDELFEIDPITGARTSVGRFQDGGVPVEGMVDIAIDLTGRIYGGTSTALYQIDPLTAAASKICDTDLRPYALAFTSDGVLFAGAGPDVVEVNLSTCGTTPLLTGSAWETSGDLVGLPDGYLYWTVRGGANDDLVRVDPVTGATFWVGEVGGSSLYGLGYDEDEGALYGFSSDGSIVRIEPLTGATVTLSSVDASWWGATTNPVVW